MGEIPLIWCQTNARLAAFEHRARITYGADACEIRTDLPSLIVAAKRSLSPFMSFDEAPADSAQAALTAVISAEAALAPHELLVTLSQTLDTLQIDTSLYRDLSSTGSRVGTATRYAIRITSTETVCVFDKQSRQISLFNPKAGALELDLLRLLKSLAMLSAAAAVGYPCQRGYTAQWASNPILADSKWKDHNTAGNVDEIRPMMLSWIRLFFVEAVSCWPAVGLQLQPLSSGRHTITRRCTC